MTFRLGGDEFVVIGTGPDAGDADKVALRLTERLNVETVIAGRTIRAGASVGYAVYPHHGGNVDALFSNADAALYRAKADGRGLARGFEPDMDLALREKRALQQDLATAISRNEITAAGEIRQESFNAQLQSKLVAAPSFAVVRARIDQAERAGTLSGDTLTEVREHVATAEKMLAKPASLKATLTQLANAERKSGDSNPAVVQALQELADSLS